MIKDGERQGSVAILDILGFRGLWGNKPPNEIFLQMTKYKDLLIKFKQKIDQGDMAFGKLLSQMNFHTFSDTIIITLEIEKEESLLKSIPLMGTIVGNLYADVLADKLLLRGAISIGSFYTNQDTLIGPSIDDCAEWYDKANWSGVQLTPKTFYAFRKLLKLKDRPVSSPMIFQPYRIPMKDGTSLDCSAINLAFYFFLTQCQTKEINVDELKDQEVIDNMLFACEELKESFYSTFLTNPTIQNKEAIKFQNTIDFIDHCIKRIKNNTLFEW